MKQIIVTVGREHGSGGKYIAEQLARQLGIAFYDKELLLASVFNAEDAARYDEKPVHLLWSRRIGENFNAPEDALARETFEHIQELADSGESFVVLGRCSDYVLRANPNAVHLFIAGKPDQKRQRLMEEKSLTADQAAQEMRRVDRDRKAYHNYYCDTKWGDARGYDLVVNSGKLGIEKTVDVSLIEDPKPGDWVIVHVGFALTRIDEKEAEATIAALKAAGAAEPIQEAVR